MTSTLRPLRIAFVVPPNDRATTLEAMQISSLLWGGMYNPIIPYYQRLNRSNPQFEEASSTAEIFEGYLRAYDPDYVVRLGIVKDIPIEMDGYTEIESSDILQGFRQGITPGYGISVFSIIDHLLETEFKFQRSFPIPFRIPQCKDSLFFTSLFGDVPKSLQKGLENYLKEFPDYQNFECDHRNYLDFLKADNMFLRRITEYGLSFSLARKRRDVIFLLDESEVIDVLSYWNYRALGYSILPISLRSANGKAAREISEEFVEAHYQPYQSNPRFFNRITLLKGPSVSEQTFQEFADSLDLKPKNSDDLFGKLSRQTLLPRIWSDWDRSRNNANRGVISSGDEEMEIRKSNDYFKIKPLFPDFYDPRGNGAGPQCANDIEIRTYGNTGEVAEVIPRGLKSMGNAVVPFSGSEVRCSHAGLVFYPSYSRDCLRLKLPEAELVFKAWFTDRGWKTELSDNGHVVRHILKQFGGMWATNLLSNEGIVAVIYKISEEKWITEKNLRGRLHRLANKTEFFNTDAVIKQLTELNIMKLGMELRCPQCRQKSWYSVSEADYAVQCHQCLQQNKIPAHSTKEIVWAYRGNGAFTSKHGHQGGLAVLLTLKLFSESRSNRITPMLSFLASKGKDQYEIDLGILIERDRFRDIDAGVLFIECKSYNHFEKKDVERMAKFAKEFPGVAIVVSTFRRDLEEEEREMLLPIARQGWQPKLVNKLGNPLIILTGNELFSHTDPRQTWKSLGGRFEKFGNWHYDGNEEETLAEITQSLYLDFDVNELINKNPMIKG